MHGQQNIYIKNPCYLLCLHRGPLYVVLFFHTSRLTLSTQTRFWNIQLSSHPSTPLMKFLKTELLWNLKHRYRTLQAENFEFAFILQGVRKETQSMGNAYKQVYYQIIAPIFDLQKYCYMFRLQPAAILTELNNIQRHIQRCYVTCRS